MKDENIDERFGAIARDPKFRSMPRRLRKTAVDERFQSMFTDKRFQSKTSVDKRGRPVSLTQAEDLHQFYERENDDDEMLEQSDNDITTQSLTGSGVDYARGGGRMVSESSSSDDSSSEDEQSAARSQIEHNWAEFDADAERLSDMESGTCRLALCNIDWDCVRAQDIMVLLNSFAPTGGCVKSVHVFLSDFGRARLAEEELLGPAELRSSNHHQEKECIENNTSDSDDGDDDEEESVIDEDVQMERIRSYQLARLRYYYAVVECDSVQTAEAIYAQCDGLELESSASRLDLRFVSDTINFDDETERDSCTSLPEAGRYQPQNFVTTALQQRKVRLTWDETDVSRQLALRRAATVGECDNLDALDLANYVAMSSSGEDDEDHDAPESEPGAGEDRDKERPLTEQEKIERYRDQLLKSEPLDTQDRHAEMEISWGVGDVSSAAETKKTALNGGDEEAASDSVSDSSQAETAENEQRSGVKKLKKRKKRRQVENADSDEAASDTEKQQLELLTMEDNSDNERHFNYSQLVKESAMSKKKLKRLQRLREKEGLVATDDFRMNVKDERFSRLFDSPLYNIDPSHPMYRRTDGMQQLVQEKQRKIRSRPHANNVEDSIGRSADTSVKPISAIDPSSDVGLLVRNIKARAKCKRPKL